MKYAACLIAFAFAASAQETTAVNILAARCQTCHSSVARMGGVDLSTQANVVKQRDRLLAAIGYQGRVKMPPTGQLPAAEAAALEKWLAAGAPFGSASVVKASQHWAFVAPVRGAGNSIDSFIDAKLREKGLERAAPADKRTLIRRVTFDMHGLPPSHADVEEFARDTRQDAYPRLVERLLASPRYGEKWGKHWLDLVRYGDTSGFEQDPYLLYAWRYRDYVIQAFNDDKPYDRFVKEQIAGDELYPEEPLSQQGTAYYTVGTNRDMLFKVEDTNREETLTDFVDTTSSVFLGLTVGCARCHDHKFDPIPQRDYYRLQAVFAPFQKTRVMLRYDTFRQFDLAENGRQFRLFELGSQMSAILNPHRTRLRDARLAKMAPEIGEAFRVDDDQRTPEQKAFFEAYVKKVEPGDDEVNAELSADERGKIARIEKRLVSMFRTYAPGPFAPGLTDVGREGPLTFVPKGEEVRAGFLTALGGGDAAEPPKDAITTWRRKALAEWIATPGNPLTARVMVNRMWQYHFGRGLNATPSDFGTRAGLPSHPELLDWLATEFVARKWSMKEMHRLMVLSGTYQQGSRPAVRALEADPENVLLSHFTRRRLEAEEVRDAVLMGAGVLNLKMGGRPVVPALEAEELYGLSQPVANAWIVTDDVREHPRRSVYMLARRNFRMPLLEAFDRPEGVLSCSRRESSTTAPQSLSLLNGAFTMKQAEALAAQVESAADPVAAAWRALYGRDPVAGEMARSRAFLEQQTKQLGSARAALTQMVRGLFNTNEFLYVE